ncbi:hypothetical protein CLUG_04936 [Clavispora lusitaniae ATCC 42720]|uniref:Uncharacterized protein n=1 Tax=Clavispora lusitaniae (strain ATCC 42720) TaxID=306902 RepID=C4Y9P6_CLAL4|nr:uncharacterized protein CLUG_04936 [Clavispora lusitaniae ATCC 42720]EEQ40809.1 hypothetical protein CLUG_04936 [Clavispora lusitaniae ATCC 42720]
MSTGCDKELMAVWKLWPQILQCKSPMEFFLSKVQMTDFSWLQKRQRNVTSSFCLIFFTGFAELFLFPIGDVQCSVCPTKSVQLYIERAGVVRCSLLSEHQSGLFLEAHFQPCFLKRHLGGTRFLCRRRHWQRQRQWRVQRHFGRVRDGNAAQRPFAEAQPNLVEFQVVFAASVEQVGIVKERVDKVAVACCFGADRVAQEKRQGLGEVAEHELALDVEQEHNHQENRESGHARLGQKQVCGHEPVPELGNQLDVAKLARKKQAQVANDPESRLEPELGHQVVVDKSVHLHEERVESLHQEHESRLAGVEVAHHAAGHHKPVEKRKNIVRKISDVVQGKHSPVVAGVVGRHLHRLARHVPVDEAQDLVHASLVPDSRVALGPHVENGGDVAPAVRFNEKLLAGEKPSHVEHNRPEKLAV